MRSGLARLVAVAVVAVVAVGTACGSRSRGSDAATSAGTSAAGAFFADYLAADGRIVRTDQGSDTVSEGQAYGLLLAAGSGDEATFGRIWTWTRTHLQRPDALLAWRWTPRDGVVDATPASDADIDAAVALFQAANEWHDAGYRSAAKAIAASVLTYESVRTAPGSLVVAGPWAAADPAVVNPSYVVSGTARYLAAQTGDRRWSSVATATSALDAHLAATYRLPPDWTDLPTGAAAARATASGAPDHSTGAQYGLDAVRLVIRLAASCSASDRALAATYATRLGAPGSAGARALTGSATVDWRNAASDIAIYAARTAAGDSTGAAAALRSAQAQQRSYPTYYGMAWIALGPMLFGPRLTEHC